MFLPPPTKIYLPNSRVEERSITSFLPLSLSSSHPKIYEDMTGWPGSANNFAGIKNINEREEIQRLYEWVMKDRYFLSRQTADGTWHFECSKHVSECLIFFGTRASPRPCILLFFSHVLTFWCFSDVNVFFYYIDSLFSITIHLFMNDIFK